MEDVGQKKRLTWIIRDELRQMKMGDHWIIGKFLPIVKCVGTATERRQAIKQE